MTRDWLGLGEDPCGCQIVSLQGSKLSALGENLRRLRLLRQIVQRLDKATSLRPPDSLADSQPRGFVARAWLVREPAGRESTNLPPPINNGNRPANHLGERNKKITTTFANSFFAARWTTSVCFGGFWFYHFLVLEKVSVQKQLFLIFHISF